MQDTMNDTTHVTDTSALREELEQFRQEKEKIRKLVGQVGGKGSAKRDRLINLVFLVLLVLLFALDILRHYVHWTIPLPPLVSLEIGVLMVSLKIIWMIHKQSKVEHFQFWILNSLEFRLNEISKRLRSIEEKLAASKQP